MRLFGRKRRKEEGSSPSTSPSPPPPNLPPGSIVPKHSPERGAELAINNTSIHRFMVLLALKTTAHFFRRKGACIPISRHLIVKTGYFTDLAEAATMQFLVEKTSLPVPRVHCAFVHKGVGYIVMDRIRGDTVAEALHTMSEAERDSFLSELRRMLVELRSLPAPSEKIQSCTGGSLRDSRIPHPGLRFGPFDTTQQFHSWLRRGLQMADLDRAVHDRDKVERMMVKQDGPWPLPVFTHGDLNPSNILVKGGRLVGIIDWEFAGWYPFYWEYTSVWYGNQLRLAWQDLVPKFLDPCPEELEMEITRQKWWAD